MEYFAAHGRRRLTEVAGILPQARWSRIVAKGFLSLEGGQRRFWFAAQVRRRASAENLILNTSLFGHSRSLQQRVCEDIGGQARSYNNLRESPVWMSRKRDILHERSNVLSCKSPIRRSRWALADLV